MTEGDLYLGRPGSLEVIPHPRGGVENTRVRARATFPTSTGGVRVSQIVGGKRGYKLQWDQLTYADFATLLAYEEGHQGTGPFALLDPAQVNMLTVNQSATTAETNDASNWTVSGSGGTLATESTTVDRGPRSLAWNFAAGASGSLTLDSPATVWSGVPVVTGQVYCFWVTARGGGSDVVMALTCRITWYSAAGAALSTSSGSPITTGSTSFDVAYVSATAPASSAYGLCSLGCTGQSAGSILYIGRAQLQRDTGAAPVAADWRPGTGVLPVAFAPNGLTEAWPWMGTGYRRGITALLQEVGP